MNTDYIAFDRDLMQEYVLRVEVGQVTAPDGATRVRLNGNGRLDAAQYRRRDEGHEAEQKERQERAGEVERVSGDISPDDAARIFEQVSLAPWERRFPQRPGIPDEAIIELTLEQSNRAATVKLWLRDAEKDPAVGPVLEQLRRYLEEFSGGRVYL